MDSDDSILIKQLQRGNHQAFNQLYSKYFLKLYGFSAKITGNASDAEEIVQEVFIKVWEMRKDLDPNLNFGGLLFTIGKRKIYNKARRRVYQNAYFHYAKNHMSVTEMLTDNEVAFKETQQLIDSTINLLPERRRQIFTMSRVEGMTNKEIAQKLNTSLSNVENNINKALKTIRTRHEILMVFIIFFGVFF